MAALTLVMVASTPLTVLAQERGERPNVDVVEVQERDVEKVRPSDKPTDRPSDRPTDRPSDRPTDRPKDKPTDLPRRCHDSITDEVRDCVEVYKCLRLADNPRRCIDVPSNDLNIRQLIWRLIKAHEWELLHRLLHWLFA